MTVRTPDSVTGNGGLNCVPSAPTSQSTLTNQGGTFGKSAWTVTTATADVNGSQQSPANNFNSHEQIEGQPDRQPRSLSQYKLTRKALGHIKWPIGEPKSYDGTGVLITIGGVILGAAGGFLAGLIAPGGLLTAVGGAIAGGVIGLYAGSAIRELRHMDRLHDYSQLCRHVDNAIANHMQPDGFENDNPQHLQVVQHSRKALMQAAKKWRKTQKKGSGEDPSWKQIKGFLNESATKIDKSTDWNYLTKVDHNKSDLTQHLKDILNDEPVGYLHQTKPSNETNYRAERGLLCRDLSQLTLSPDGTYAINDFIKQAEDCHERNPKQAMSFLNSARGMILCHKRMNIIDDCSQRLKTIDEVAADQLKFALTKVRDQFREQNSGASGNLICCENAFVAAQVGDINFERFIEHLILPSAPEKESSQSEEPPPVYV